MKQPTAVVKDVTMEELENVHGGLLVTLVVIGVLLLVCAHEAY